MEQKTTKRCTKCKREKLLAAFYKRPEASDGRRPSCIECCRTAHQARVAHRLRRCGGCKEYKPKGEFRKIVRSGRSALRCAVCAPEAIADVHTPRCPECEERHPLASYTDGHRRLKKCSECRAADREAEAMRRQAMAVVRRPSHDPEPRSMREYYSRCAADEAKADAAAERLRANTLEVLGR